LISRLVHDNRRHNLYAATHGASRVAPDLRLSSSLSGPNARSIVRVVHVL
jgi:hypothetical protein